MDEIADASQRRRVADLVVASVKGVPVDQAPVHLCRACVQMLPVSGASVLVMAASNWLTLCSSDPKAAQLAETQLTLGDGPCLTAYSSRAPVIAADLTRGRDARRWPVFAARAAALGAGAVFSLPLTVGAVTTGTLDLYRESAGGLSQADLAVALLAADAVTLAVLRMYADVGRYGDPGGEPAWFDATETDFDEVHQATGMMMIQLDVGVEEALLRLRAHAFARGETVSALARQVVDRQVRFDD